MLSIAASVFFIFEAKRPNGFFFRNPDPPFSRNLYHRVDGNEAIFPAVLSTAATTTAIQGSLWNVPPLRQRTIEFEL